MRDGNRVDVWIFGHSAQVFSLPMRDGNECIAYVGDMQQGFSLPMRDGNSGLYHASEARPRF